MGSPAAGTAAVSWRVLLRRGYRLLAGALTLLGFVLLGTTCTPLVDWYARRLAGNWSDASGDTLIVLAGDVNRDGYLGLSSYWRSVYAARAFRQGRFRRVVVSGAGVAQPMREFLVAYGVPAEVIQSEARSHSTRENALYTARALAADSGRKVLLTSDYHMFRAHRAFLRAGLRVEPCPIPDALKGGWRRRWPAFLDEAVETAKIGYYFARGWI